MKYLCCSDIHLRGTAPVFRKDNYIETMFNKLQFIVKTANGEEARILIAGDIFDTARVPHEVVNRAMEILMTADKPISICAGQHDQSYHSKDNVKSPLYSMYLAGVVRWQHDRTVYSCDWDQQDVPDDPSKILLIHRTITPKEPPFFLKTAISAKEAMDAYPSFEWIVSGDYHPVHITENDRGQVLINCGCMLRNAKDQRTHKPQVHLIDLDYDTYTSIPVPHKPFSDVFDLRLIDMSKKKNFKVALESLSAALLEGHNIKEFKDLVQHVAKLQGLCTAETNLLNTILLEARL